MMPALATTGTVSGHTGATGPGSAIRYDVDVNMEGGVVQTVPNVTPIMRPFPDAVNTVPAPNGSFCFVYIVGGRFQIVVTGETFEFEEACE